MVAVAMRSGVSALQLESSLFGTLGVNHNTARRVVAWFSCFELVFKTLHHTRTRQEAEIIETDLKRCSYRQHCSCCTGSGAQDSMGLLAAAAAGRAGRE
jgi:hypothetical protein